MYNVSQKEKPNTATRVADQIITSTNRLQHSFQELKQERQQQQQQQKSFTQQPVKNTAVYPSNTKPVVYTKSECQPL